MRTAEGEGPLGNKDRTKQDVRQDWEVRSGLFWLRIGTD
jgi:hypothetical protein